MLSFGDIAGEKAKIETYGDYPYDMRVSIRNGHNANCSMISVTLSLVEVERLRDLLTFALKQHPCHDGK